MMVKDFLPNTILFGALCILQSCQVTLPKDQLSETPPQITEWMVEPAILVFSKTSDWRHNEGIAGADRFFADFATARGYGLYTTENNAVFTTEILARFDLVVFNNMTGDTLSVTQETVFQEWLESGGAWIGLHGSGDNSHRDWAWYDKTLIGPEFIGHIMAPQIQSARLINLAPQHSIMTEIPLEWFMEDEWYSFDSTPQDFGMTPLAGLDETSYSPRNTVVERWPTDLRMSADPRQHPVIWSQCIGHGRAVYSAIGHTQFVYDDTIYQKLLTNALLWTTRQIDHEGKHCN